MTGTDTRRGVWGCGTTAAGDMIGAEMYGRYSLVAAIGGLEGLFIFMFGDTDYTPSYNIVPTQRVLTVVGPRPDVAA